MEFKKSSLVSINGRSLLVPFILVTSLFFLWGFAHSLLDVLNKHFQDILGITKAKSGWIQAALYGGYAVMAIPAGLIMNKFGYKKGILLGLITYSFGAFLFLPASYAQSFEITLICLFVIACGLTCLETAANPYSTVLGPKESSAQRLNLSQSFNGLGWIMGPLIGGLLIFGNSKAGEDQFFKVAVPYLIVAVVVLLVAILFFFAKLPEINEEETIDNNSVPTRKSKWAYKHFKLAILAQFLYVAAQTGINSFFINYTTENIPGLSDERAAYLLSLGFVFFMVGRFSGSISMRWLKAQNLLLAYAIVNSVCMLLVIAGLGWISIVALYVTYFCMSIMFPTIFALGLKDLGLHTKKAASFLVMCVAGGAICPMFMGWIADISSMAIGFVVPMICFIYIAYFGWKGYKIV